ncbi:Alpha/Beta hydrolase protein [Lentinula raphanica]|nr:Alpha/Beta hydrolase protein [Lentinula raphanica]
MSGARDKTYNERISWKHRLNVAFLFIRIPLTLLIYTLSSPFVPSNAYTAKPLKRRLYDRFVQVISRLSIAESALLPRRSGLNVYHQWIKGRSPDLVSVVDELYVSVNEGKDGSSNDCQLLWVGPKRTDKVILHFPGGAYMFPVSEMVFKFWRYAQLEWEKQGLKVGIAVLSYTVGSGKDAAFPIQLVQATRALKYLLSMGCDLSNIQLVGDSAGGNLVAQLLLHAAYPVPLPIPPLELPAGARLRGVYMMSPWVSLCNSEQWGSSIQTKDDDIIVHKTGRSWGNIYINNIPNGNDSDVSLSQLLPYADPISAPSGWYSSLPTIVDRIFVSAGKEERLLDPVQTFFNTKVQPYFGSTKGTLILQDGGIHDDPFLDFAVADEPLENSLTAVILGWIAEGFSNR